MYRVINEVFYYNEYKYIVKNGLGCKFCEFKKRNKSCINAVYIKGFCDRSHHGRYRAHKYDIIHLLIKNIYAEKNK